MRATCRIEGCERRATNSPTRLCRMHYRRWANRSSNLSEPGLAGLGPAGLAAEADSNLPHGTTGPVPPCPNGCGVEGVSLWSHDEGQQRRWFCVVCSLAGRPDMFTATLASVPWPSGHLPQVPTDSTATTLPRTAPVAGMPLPAVTSDGHGGAAGEQATLHAHAGAAGRSDNAALLKATGRGVDTASGPSECLPGA